MQHLTRRSASGAISLDGAIQRSAFEIRQFPEPGGCKENHSGIRPTQTHAAEVRKDRVIPAPNTITMFSEKGGVAAGTHLNFAPVVEAVAQRNAYSAVERDETEPDESQILQPDNSLTSLSWLQNFKLIEMFSPEVRLCLLPPSPCSEDAFSWETLSNSSTSQDETKEAKAAQDDEMLPLSPIHKCLVQSAMFRNESMKYRNSTTKPSISEASLIYLSMQHSRSGKVTLHHIFRWAKTNFKYFKSANTGWQNLIKQTLRLNKLFIKVPRSHGDSSKGSYWMVNPQLKHILTLDDNGQNSEYNKKEDRKRSYSFSGDQRQAKGVRKRARSDNQPADPCGLPGDLDWVSLLSSQRVSCGSCPSQACRPVYGSPILGPPDLGQVGDPMVCSPLILPATMASTSDLSPQTPIIRDPERGKDLEEDILKPNSPSPHLLPWAESRPQSPCLHPWAESKETTLRTLYRHKRTPMSLANHSHSAWSPETSFSSSCSTISGASLPHKHKKITSESYIY